MGRKLKINLENCEKTAQNKCGKHNKFYDVELIEDVNGHTTVEIWSGAFGKTRVQQKPKATLNGWDYWRDGLDWVLNQVAKKIRDRNYSLELLETEDDYAMRRIEDIANACGRNGRYTSGNFTYF